MESLKQLFKIGYGPSSSHTMGPANAAMIFKSKNPSCNYEVILYGSLALTGKGHFTDKVLKEILGGNTVINFNYDVTYSYHPNGMKFIAYSDGKKVDEWLVFSVGGGSLKNLNEPRDVNTIDNYPHNTLEEIINYCNKNSIKLVDYVKKFDSDDIFEYLNVVLNKMFEVINKGIYKTGILDGGLNVERKSSFFYQKYLENHDFSTLLYASALATSEENASGNVVVTSPTCGASAVLPAVLYTEYIMNNISKEKLIEALCVAGIIGDVVKTKGSISGAEVGCQGEVGVACSMAAAAKAYLLIDNLQTIEYAAEIALEHHLGMTCDPIGGLVQIPCIERNAIAASDAISCANYASMTNGDHKISFDSVVQVMKQTGMDLQEKYRETALGGLAIKKGN